MAEIKTTTDVMCWLEKRTNEAQQKQDLRQAAAPVQMFLPGLDETVRAMPNHIARSSLFAPVARGRKKYHDETPLVSRADAVITYSGIQLDEAQADVWMHLVFLARHTPLGEPVEIVRGLILKSIGRSTGKNDYQWLHRALKAFMKGTIIIEVKRKDGSLKYHIGNTEAFHMLSNFRYNEESELYTFTIDPRWKALFGGREYALIDWEKRLQISQGQDLAKALQRLFATSNKSTQRFVLDWLKEKMQYSGRMRDFKASLNKALAELKRLEIVADWKIEQSTRNKEQLVVSLTKKVSG